MPKIFIDPGHGGTDPGAGGNGLQEKNLTLAISLRIQQLLTNYQNVQVKMSRNRDETISLRQRVRMANVWGADYYVAIHINAGGGKGYEDFISTTPSRETVANQNIMHEEIVKQLGMVNRGKKRRNFYVLRETVMPAILTENGFIDNREDAAKLKQSSFIDKIALGHVNGLVKIFGLKQKNTKPTPTPTPTPTPKPTPTPEPPRERENQTSVFQEWLNSNYNTGLNRDGIYGPRTKSAAIKALQTELNRQYNARLAVDGIWGPRTRAAVRLVSTGDRGNLVYIIQGMLYSLGYNPKGFDGIFGKGTANAVTAFQKDQKIAQDGIVGKNTFEAMFD